jgi:hypothetical protein
MIPAESCRARFVSWIRRDGETDPPTVRNPAHRIRLQSRCPGCGHQGPIRSDENEAIEDACDHAHPGWRTMPLLEPYPYELTKRPRWEAAARAAYPPGWFEREGPVREQRGPIGGRHVLGKAPGGGYAMGVLGTRPDPKHVEATQESLFGGPAK